MKSPNYLSHRKRGPKDACVGCLRHLIANLNCILILFLRQSIQAQIRSKILALKTLGRVLGWSDTFRSGLPRPPLVELSKDAFLKVCLLSVAEIQDSDWGVVLSSTHVS